MDREALEELKKIDAEATPGPWIVFDGWVEWPHRAGKEPRTISIHAEDLAEPTICCVAEPAPESLDVIARELANAKFIAAARTDLPQLIEEVERLTNEREQLVEEIRRDNSTMNQLRHLLMCAPQSVSDALGLPAGWTDLEDAVREASNA